MDLRYAVPTRQHNKTWDDTNMKLGPDEVTLEKEKSQQASPTLTNAMKKCKQAEQASNGKLGGAYIQLMTCTLYTNMGVKN